MHFHTESEHTIANFKYGGELHIVFGKVGESVFEDKFCVIGILIDIKNNDMEKTKQERDVVNIFKPTTPSVILSKSNE